MPDGSLAWNEFVIATHERPVLQHATRLLRERLALVEAEIARRP